MVLTVEIQDAIDALTTQQILVSHSGTGIESGCEASLDTGAAGIVVDVAAGAALINQAEVAVAGGSVQLATGNASYPRKDVVYVDSNGDIAAETGVAANPLPLSEGGSAQAGRKTYQPAPPDLADYGSNVAAVAEVWVPAGANGPGDMTDAEIEYVRDRRVPPFVIPPTETYDDADAVAAINADPDHGTTASHNYFSGDHADLTNVSAGQHRSDANVVSTVEGAGTLAVSISGNADSVDGYDIQKNGTDGVGIINFKTT